jgi:hypothetical protein
MRVLRVNEQWIGMLEHGEVAGLIKKTDKSLALRVVHFEADPDYKDRDEKLVEKGFKFLLIEKKKDKGLGLDIETEMEVSEGGPRWNHTVRSVTRGSAADKAGFSPGQLLVKLNGFDLLGRDKKEFTSIARNFLSEPQISFIVAIPDFERRESSSSEESEPPSKRGKRVSEGRYSLDEIQANGDHATEEDISKVAVDGASSQVQSAEAPVPSPRAAANLPKARLLRLVKASTGSYGISVASDQDIGLHYVTLVTKNQPGALAGLLVDDCIWEINGKPVTKADSVRDCMREQPRHVVLLVTTKAEAKWFQDAGSRPDEFHAEKWASRYGQSGVPRELTIFTDQEKMGFAFKSAATDTENNFGEHFITSVTQGTRC